MASKVSVEHLQLIAQGNFVLLAVVSTTVLSAVYLLCNALYSVTLHPLASFPGPVSTALSRIPWWLSCITGNQVQWIQNLHSIYGPVVRFSPNDLSYMARSDEVWKEVHGYSKGDQEYRKASEWFLTPPNGIRSFVSADSHDHRRIRRLLAPAFADRALKQQSPLFQKHVNVMVAKIQEHAQKNTRVDMVQMYNFTTFDIMGDLTFGQPLGLLEKTEYSPWIESVFQSVKVIPFIQIIQYYPWLQRLYTLFEPKWVKTMKNTHFHYSVQRVDKRLENGSDQPDFWNIITSAAYGAGLSLDEMHSNAEFLLLAGSETSATLLSALTYYLLTNPKPMDALKLEVRKAFAHDCDITMAELAKLKYLNACILEALRMHSPVPIGVPRIVPAGGRIILDKWVAAGTRVSIHHYSTYHDPKNFANPNQFAPERWLGGLEFLNDSRDVMHPFSTGPRNCLGQNMAMYEMRLILAKVIFNFELELCDPTIDWAMQKAYVLWEKKPLMCTIRHVA